MAGSIEESARPRGSASPGRRRVVHLIDPASRECTRTCTHCRRRRRSTRSVLKGSSCIMNARQPVLLQRAGPCRWPEERPWFVLTDTRERRHGKQDGRRKPKRTAEARTRLRVFVISTRRDGPRCSTPPPPTTRMEIRTWRSAIADLKSPPPGTPSGALGEGTPGRVWRCDAAISRYHKKTCLFCCAFFITIIFFTGTEQTFPVC